MDLDLFDQTSCLELREPEQREPERRQQERLELERPGWGLEVQELQPVEPEQLQLPERG